ncbi:hypothetical protein DFQ28_000848 [Apophysomyces sp. BC1034]|nr:hypothetical protein DFQ30_004422 [Apophysomyces sp. BC1015]KAG0181103.1 hypothetical protein DFQ29_009334 [Apophysomyces sp. BC1021]KAG0191145.1 hypothetical protein DFQ28_000848 [Apophysomyces sp. BC1034]
MVAYHSKPHALIVGGGVTGLTSAWVLLERGYRVTVISKEYASEEVRITSQIAGALWEWPPAVCGRHTDPISIIKSKRWCMVAYNKLEQMANDRETSEKTGVKMRLANFFFRKPVNEDSYQLAKMNEIKENLRGFRHDAAIIEELGVSKEYGVVDVYQHLAPVIDTDKYMYWLIDHVRKLGASVLTREIHGDLFTQEDSLLRQYGADVLLNCTGLSGKELANDDTVYPLRGSLVRVINDGTKFPRINQAMALSLDGREGESDLIFIVPRNDNTLILGGMTEPNQWDLGVNLENYKPIRDMYERNIKFFPPLAKGEIDPKFPVANGLRPFRKQNVRVEREDRLHEGTKKSKLVHSYGQGGAGFTLSFGCAEDLADIVDQVIAEAKTEAQPETFKSLL